MKLSKTSVALLLIQMAIVSTISAPARMIPSRSASTPTMKPETS